MSEFLGLLVLLLICAGLLVALLSVVLVRSARWPPRRTAAWAIARGLPCDPGDLGLAFEEWTLDRPGAVRLPVWEIRGERARSDADAGAEDLTAVFVHAWGQARVATLGRLDAWRTRFDRLVLYDLRGHGDATGGPTNIGSGEDEDLLVLLEQLGTGRFILVGYSMGAVIAIRAAARAAPVVDRIAGVVAYGPYTSLHPSLHARLRLLGLPPRPMTDLALAWLRLRGVRHEPTEKVAASLRCPLLVVQGVDDAVAPLAGAEAITQAAPDGELCRVEDAAHLDAPHLDAAGHDDALVRFLDRVTAPV